MSITPGPGADPKPPTRRTSTSQRWLQRAWIGLYRRTGGRLAGRVGPTRLLLLTTRGRRSGRPHTVPVGYFDHYDTRFVVASNSGQPLDPAWYLNLLTHPEVTVQVGQDQYTAVAAPATGHERQQLWEYLMAIAPLYRRYAQSAREIPLVILRRTG